MNNCPDLRSNTLLTYLQVGSDNILIPTFTYKAVSQRTIALIITLILFILAGGSALAWYFLGKKKVDLNSVRNFF